MWNLAKDQVHYDAIATVMRLRENLRYACAAILVPLRACAALYATVDKRWVVFVVVGPLVADRTLQR